MNLYFPPLPSRWPIPFAQGSSGFSLSRICCSFPLITERGGFFVAADGIHRRFLCVNPLLP